MKNINHGFITMFLSIFGLILFMLPFFSFPPPLGGLLQNFLFFKIGVILITLSIFYSILLIFLRQKGWMKYTPFFITAGAFVFMYYLLVSINAS